MQDVDQSFTKYLAYLSTVISSQEVLQVVGMFKVILPKLGTGLSLLRNMYRKANSKEERW